jgi:hypothetical protein
MGNIKIKDETLDRLRNYLSLEYKGKIWGKVTVSIEEAINEYLDIREKKTAVKK